MGGGRTIAKIHLHWLSGAQVELADGRRLRQRANDPLWGTWDWIDDAGSVVDTFDARVFGWTTTIQPGPSSARLSAEERTALLLIGLWLIQLYRSHAEVIVECIGMVLI